MRLEKNLPGFVLARARQRERHAEFVNWFPFPALISFGLVTVLGIFLLPGLNPRLGNPAHLINYPAETEQEGSLWLAVKIVNDEVFVVTSEKRIFRWPTKLKSSERLDSFVEFLKEKAQHEILTAALSKETSPQRLSVVIAADQRLKYLHIRPILNALAEAKITHYAFETTITDVKPIDKNADHGH